MMTPENGPNLDPITTHEAKRALNYGWIVALAGASLLFINTQFSYTFGVFLPPLIAKFAWSRAAVSSISTIRNLVTALLSPVAGTLYDRYGPKKLILLGVFLCGLGYIVAWRASSLWQFYLGFGLLIGVSSAIIITPTIVTVNKWFAGRSAMANGITMTGPSTSQILVPPISAFLVGRYGLEICFLITGLAVWVWGTFSWSLIKTPVSGTLPQSSPEDSQPMPPTDVGNGFSLSETFHMPAFWILFIVYGIIAICYQMISVHIVVAAIDIGAPGAAAAGILTVMGITNTAARLVVGGIGDRIGKKTTLAISIGAQALLVFILGRVSSLQNLYLVTSLYAFFYGSVIPNILSITSSSFGTKAAGRIMGTITLSYLSGAAIGPILGGFIFDVTGSYYAAYLTAAIILALSFILCLVMRAPRKNINLT